MLFLSAVSRAQAGDEGGDGDVPSSHDGRVTPEDDLLEEQVQPRGQRRQRAQEQREGRQRPALALEALQQRRQGEDVHERVEPVEVDEGVGVEAVYCIPHTASLA